MISQNITQLIGKTPMVELRAISPGPQVEILAKLEMFNPSGSVKDRPALGMIQQAEADGILRRGETLVEPTSGNTGISLAMIAASRGYHFTATMPASMSRERQQILRALGAEVILTGSEEGMRGAIAEAERRVQEYGHVMLSQFTNPANPEVHSTTTAREILHDTGGCMDYFTAGVGTGGTFTGVGAVLRKEVPGIRLVAVEPANSAVLSGGPAGGHGVQGIGAGFIPAIMDTTLMDEVITVTDDDAMSMARRLAVEEGLFVGISSGAAATAALKLAERAVSVTGARCGDVIRIVTILPDTGERYLSLLGDSYGPGGVSER